MGDGHGVLFQTPEEIDTLSKIINTLITNDYQGCVTMETIDTDFNNQPSQKALMAQVKDILSANK